MSLLTHRKQLLGLFIAVALLVYADLCAAHVKWFSDFRSNRDPVDLESLANDTALALLALSAIAIFATKFTALGLDSGSPARLDERRLRREHALASAILRVAAIAAILLTWRSNILFAPELRHDSPYIAALQLTAVAGVAPRYGSMVLSVCIFAMFLLGVTEFGLFHMLDYTVFIGLGLFFLLHRSEDPEYRVYGMTALYIGTGISLCWAGLEKLVFPQWAAAVVALHPELALGFPVDFFVLGAAFVEFSVGFLIATQTMPRLFAVLLTGLMAFTATLFGMIEIIGHLIFHAVLLSFIIIGATTPSASPSASWRGLSAMSVRYAILYVMTLSTLLLGYLLMANAAW